MKFELNVVKFEADVVTTSGSASCTNMKPVAMGGDLGANCSTDAIGG